MSPAIDALEAELLNERVHVGNNPVLTMCAANAIAVVNKATGERKIDKAKETGRVDGIVALAMAFGSAAGDGVTDEGDMNAWLQDPILI
jgi:phage terminase large subunit-like protein